MSSIKELAKILDLGVLTADAVVAITNRINKDKMGKQITDQDKMKAIKDYAKANPHKMGKQINPEKGGKGNYAKGGYTKKYAYGGGVRKAKMNKYG